MLLLCPRPTDSIANGVLITIANGVLVIARLNCQAGDEAAAATAASKPALRRVGCRHGGF